MALAKREISPYGQQVLDTYDNLQAMLLDEYVALRRKCRTRMGGYGGKKEIDAMIEKSFELERKLLSTGMTLTEIYAKGDAYHD